MKKTFRKTALFMGAFALMGGVSPVMAAAAGPELGVQEVHIVDVVIASPLFVWPFSQYP